MELRKKRILGGITFIVLLLLSALLLDRITDLESKVESDSPEKARKKTE